MSGTQGTSAEFDAEKVARMSQAIADGSFTVNPEAIADKLLANPVIENYTVSVEQDEHFGQVAQ